MIARKRGEANVSQFGEKANEKEENVSPFGEKANEKEEGTNTDGEIKTVSFQTGTIFNKHHIPHSLSSSSSRENRTHLYTVNSLEVLGEGRRLEPTP